MKVDEQPAAKTDEPAPSSSPSSNKPQGGKKK